MLALEVAVVPELPEPEPVEVPPGPPEGQAHETKSQAIAPSGRLRAIERRSDLRGAAERGGELAAEASWLVATVGPARRDSEGSAADPSCVR